MTSVTLAFLQPAATGSPAIGDAVPGVRDLERVASFEDALTRHGANAAAAPQLVAEVQPATQPGVVSDVSPADVGTDAGAEQRAREALQLDGAPAAAAATGDGGDMILQGLQRLRGVFDAREARVASLLESGAVDSNSLMAMQLEVSQYTLLVDVTSKLTGKSTQIFDTLMKGQ